MRCLIRQPLVPSPTNMEGRRRVLFLDVDGVLMLFHRRGEWNERCLLQLKRVLTELHPVEIVLSSNWKRSEESMQELVAQFKRLSFPGWEEASVTDLQVTPELEYETSVAHSRVREIVEWLRRAKEEKSLVPPHSGASLSDIAWVAVDDMNLEEADGNVMKGHFVRTGREEGLVESKADKVLGLFLQQQHQQETTASTVIMEE